MKQIMDKSRGSRVYHGRHFHEGTSQDLSNFIKRKVKENQTKKENIKILGK